MLDEVEDTGKTAAEESDRHLRCYEHLWVGKVPCPLDQFEIRTSVDSLTGYVCLQLITQVNNVC